MVRLSFGVCKFIKTQNHSLGYIQIKKKTIAIDIISSDFFSKTIFSILKPEKNTRDKDRSKARVSIVSCLETVIITPKPLCFLSYILIVIRFMTGLGLI